MPERAEKTAEQTAPVNTAYQQMIAQITELENVLDELLATLKEPLQTRSQPSKRTRTEDRRAA